MVYSADPPGVRKGSGGLANVFESAASIESGFVEQAGRDHGWWGFGKDEVAEQTGPVVIEEVEFWTGLFQNLTVSLADLQKVVLLVADEIQLPQDSALEDIGQVGGRPGSGAKR
jgi:hypothetical protein